MNFPPLSPERVRELTATIPPVNILPFPEAAKLNPKCPWCQLELDGEVFVCFSDRKLVFLSQTKRIGKNDYTWLHSPEGCHVPKLCRISPKIVLASSGSNE